jgi:hypothetical protein
MAVYRDTQMLSGFSVVVITAGLYSYLSQNGENLPAFDAM